MGSQWAVAGGRWVVVRFSNYFFSTKRMGTAEGWYSFLELIFFEERMGGRLKVGRLVFILELTFFEERMGERLKVGRLVFVLELTFFEERMGGRLKVEK